MPTDLLKAYLSRLNEIRPRAVAETSYYPALETLFSAVGASLKPVVTYITHPKGNRAGLPDGAFFTQEQLKGEANIPALTPSRGVVEVKGTAADMEALLQTPQVRKYLQAYGQALVINLRSFVVTELENRNGEEVVRVVERYDLAPDEASFWQAAANAQATSDTQSERFLEFLRRAMMRRAQLSTPADLAATLASYAKEAHLRLEAGGTAQLTGLRNALEELLGVSFATTQGEHFFRATLVQTLFYGVFSAWVIHHQRGVRRPFDWRSAAFDLHLRVLQRLFTEIAQPAAMETMNLVEVVDAAQETLDRVNREAFFKNFSGEHAVQYFYEPFLEAYDPELREQFGVWYTPDEVVEYMVEQVDRALRNDLGLPLGLASENVVILDPCTGTGTYILKVLERIHRTLEEAGRVDAFSGQDLKEIALKRVFGFELMPAPFVVAHMRLTMQLKKFGFELGERERLGVYLTNALTGYEDKGSPDLSHFGEFLSEWQESSNVKQKEPVLVVLGNPPYRGFAGIGMREEQELSDAYRDVKAVPRPVGQGLNDLYVRFFRMAERQITEPKAGEETRGVLCFVSNYSWLDGLSHTGMREHYLNAFDRITIDNLNGDRYRTGKLTPEGRPDPSIFSTPFNREGIQIGTAIALMVRRERHQPTETVQYRDLWSTGKLQQLAAEAKGISVPTYREVKPEPRLGAPLRPLNVSTAYLEWPTLEQLFPTSFPGVKTSRDGFLVSIDKERLRDRVTEYFDKNIKNDVIKAKHPNLMRIVSGFDGPAIRSTLQRRGLLADNFVPYTYRPFDNRWLYWEPQTKLLDRNRAEYIPHVFAQNMWLAVAANNRRGYDPPTFTRYLSSMHVIERSANFFPLLLTDGLRRFENQEQTVRVNGSSTLDTYLEATGVTAEDVFLHALAVMHSLAYRTENDGALRQDWPRIPLPMLRERLLSSAELGRKVAAFLDQTVKFAPSLEVRSLGEAKTVNGKTPTLEDRQVSVRWGRMDNGKVMPGPGKTEAVEGAFDSRLGTEGLRVYFSPNLYLDNVPLSVWEYKLGGYQVIKKWLSYREYTVLGRALEVAEIRELRATIQRIASLLLLAEELDASYRGVITPSLKAEGEVATTS